VVVPSSVAPAPFAPRASDTLPLKPVATLPKASRADTTIAGESDAPATAALGPTVKASVCALPAPIENGSDSVVSAPAFAKAMRV
jgi:hypothetical protein